MEITHVDKNDAAMVPWRHPGAEMICKESAKSRDYFDSWVAHRSRPNHIAAFFGPLGDSK